MKNCYAPFDAEVAKKNLKCYLICTHQKHENYNLIYKELLKGQTWGGTKIGQALKISKLGGCRQGACLGVSKVVKWTTYSEQSK